MKAQYTRSQAQIIQVLKSLNYAISAQDLYLELKHRDQPLGLATVYRALDALKVQGTVKSLTLTRSNHQPKSLTFNSTKTLKFCCRKFTNLPIFHF